MWFVIPSAGPSKKGANGFSDIIWVNYVDDVIYDGTHGYGGTAAQMF